MLRGNLSTRPFYNESIVTLVLALAALVAIGLAAFNVSEILALSKQRSTFADQAKKDRDEAARVRGEATGLTRNIDPSRLKYLAASTREANSLIDQRTFSWTAFFGYVEKTLPLDARLLAVAPRVEKGEFKIAMIVMGKRRADIKSFTDGLMGTGVFYDVGPTAQATNDDGTVTATIEGGYFTSPAMVRSAPSNNRKPAGAGRKGHP